MTPGDERAEAEAFARDRLPWHTDDASRTFDPREDEGRSYPNRDAYSDGAEEGNDGWETGRAAGCNE